MSNDASVSSISSSTHYDDSEKESGVGDGNESSQLGMEEVNQAVSEATTARMEPQSTKVYYYIDKGTDPFATIVDVPPSQITLKHFKATLPHTNYKYFNHNIVDGVTEKTEVKDDNEILLPSDNNKIFMTILTDEQATPIAPAQHSIVPLRKQSQALQHSNYRGSRFSKLPTTNNYLRRRGSLEKKARKNSYAEDTDYGDSYAHGAFSDGDSSVFTEFTSVSQQRKRFRHNRKPLHHRRLSPSFVSTSFSDASMAIDVIEVSFDLSQGRLGLKILINEEQHSTHQQICIIVAEVEPGSLAARDRRIKKNMIILEVNEFRLSEYGKEEAESILKEACSGRQRIVTFVFAQTERERFNPHDDTVYPVDTSTWVKQTMFHTNLPNTNLPAINEEYRFSPNPLKLVHNPCCLAANGFPSSGVGSSLCSESSYPANANMTQLYQRQPKRFNVHKNTNADIAVAMVLPGGLELKHKVNGKKTFASTEIVDWLRSNVHGLEESAKCQKFANKLVEDGLIDLAMEKKFHVNTEGHYYFTDKLKKLALAQMNKQKPTMDDTLYIPQKGIFSTFKRLLCVGPNRTKQPHPQHVQPQFRQPHHPAAIGAVRQLHDENSPPSFAQPLQYPPYRSSLYTQSRTHQTYIP